jgi:hypothetical protein
LVSTIINYTEIINQIKEDFSLSNITFVNSRDIDIEFYKKFIISAPFEEFSEDATLNDVSNLLHELGHFMTCNKKQLTSDRNFGFDDKKHPININKAIDCEANALAYQGFLLNLYSGLAFDEFWEFEMEVFLDTFSALFKRIPNEELHKSYFEGIGLNPNEFSFQKFPCSQEMTKIIKAVEKSIKIKTINIYNIITIEKIKSIKIKQNLLCESQNV